MSLFHVVLRAVFSQMSDYSSLRWTWKLNTLTPKKTHAFFQLYFFSSQGDPTFKVSLILGEKSKKINS